MPRICSVYAPKTARICSVYAPYMQQIPRICSVYAKNTPYMLRICKKYSVYAPYMLKNTPYMHVYFRICSVYAPYMSKKSMPNTGKKKPCRPSYFREGEVQGANAIGWCCQYGAFGTDSQATSKTGGATNFQRSVSEFKKSSIFFWLKVTTDTWFKCSHGSFPKACLWNRYGSILSWGGSNRYSSYIYLVMESFSKLSFWNQKVHPFSFEVLASAICGTYSFGVKSKTRPFSFEAVATAKCGL